MTINAGNSACTTGLSGAIYSVLSTDSNAAFPTNPLSGSAATIVKALCYDFAQGIAAVVNAGGVNVTDGGSNAGDVGSIEFAGAGVTVSIDNTTHVATVTISGGGSLPTATAANQPLVSTAPGTTYAAGYRRVPTDAHDVLVYTCDDAAGSGTVVNTGSAGSADLTCEGSPRQGRAGLFDLAVDFPGTNGVDAYGAAAVTPAYPITLSLWTRSRGFPGGYTRFLCKSYAPASWSAPYLSLSIEQANASNGTWEVVIAVSGSLHTLSVPYADRLQLGVWHHIGLTYDGATLAAWKDGVQVASLSLTGAIDYGSNGLWFFGAVPTVALGGSGDPVDGLIDDVRVANVARAASWWMDAYQRGVGTLAP